MLYGRPFPRRSPIELQRSTVDVRRYDLVAWRMDGHSIMTMLDGIQVLGSILTATGAPFTFFKSEIYRREHDPRCRASEHSLF